jgi:hypothetical protein
MATAVKNFLDQVSASCRLITSVSQTPALLDQVAPGQKQHLLRMAAEVTLDAADMEKVVSDVQASAFTGVDQAEILGVVAGRFRGANGTSAEDASRKGQNYEAMVHYMRESVWESMKEGPVQLIQHLIALGLRQPSEPTFQTMTCLLLMVQHGIDPAVNLSTQTKNATLKLLKTWFTRAVTGDKTKWDIKLLPDVPAELLRRHPAIYNLAFDGEGPMTTPISVVTLAIMKDTCYMRMTPKRLGTVHRAVDPSGSGSTGSGTSPMEQHMSAMFQRFTAMMERTMQGPAAPRITMCGGAAGRGSSPSCRDSTLDMLNQPNNFSFWPNPALTYLNNEGQLGQRRPVTDMPCDFGAGFSSPPPGSRAAGSAGLDGEFLSGAPVVPEPLAPPETPPRQRAPAPAPACAASPPAQDPTLYV